MWLRARSVKYALAGFVISARFYCPCAPTCIQIFTIIIFHLEKGKKKDATIISFICQNFDTLGKLINPNNWM